MTGEAKAQEIRDHYGISFEMKDPKGGDEYEAPYVEIEVLFIPKEKRGQGIATDVMFDLIRWADSNGYILALDPSSDFGSSVARLRKFYGQFGFVGNKGRNKDFRTRYAMIRQPKKKADKQMKELNQLVENFFQPKRDTLGLDQLVEMVEEVINEAKYDEQDIRQILSVLRADERFKEAKVHPSSTSNTLVLTNMGGAPNRDAALDLIGADKNRPYKKGSNYFIGGTLPKGFKVLFKAGRNPFAKENIAFEQLRSELIKASKGLDDAPLSLAFTDGKMQTDLYTAEPPVAEDTGKRGKSDFSIGDKVFISHKDGVSPRDFGQYSGLSKRSQLENLEDVQAFDKILNKVFSDLDLKEYPSSIDFQQDIKDPTLALKAVFGKDYPSEESGYDNVDFVIQGNVSLEPIMNPETDEPTGRFMIKGDRIFSRREADQNKEELKAYFPEGYLPILSVRKGDSGRNSFGIRGARATVYTKGGRHPNFIFSTDSTPEDISFVSHSLDNRQIKNVQKMVEDLKEKGITRENNPMLDKMLSSISNYP